ncbi:MAG TPA: hypothetical protein VK501_14925 [Baekduia sp.]|uniref:hypothetical protein n=1 Tax=Baekduia sp. TaxID=2600305 RepID=UPI002C607BA7|nr:hypothetical protein [Baekduia sp.]HMJ35202.1 hypothetical protein [Baekduia sp.]
MSHHDRDFWAHYWPCDGRLAGLHRVAVGRRIARGETPLAAQLHSIAGVVACADPAERAAMLAMGPSEEVAL